MTATDFPSAHDLRELLPQPGAISVVAFALDPPEGVSQRLRGVLAADERARADRFHFDKHRRRYVVGRGVLRHLLGAAFGSSPSAIAFEYGRHGKPSVAGADLPFNLSNSSDLAIIAIGGGTPLGVDVERLRAMEDADAIAQRFFSAPEVEAFRRLDTDDRDTGFFRCWTRKEAYIKAIGDGLAMPLDRFQVAFGRGEPSRFLSIGDDAAEAAAWRLLHFDPVPGYIAALAVRGPLPAIQARQYDPAHLIAKSSEGL